MSLSVVYFILYFSVWKCLVFICFVTLSLYLYHCGRVRNVFALHVKKLVRATDKNGTEQHRTTECKERNTPVPSETFGETRTNLGTNSFGVFSCDGCFWYSMAASDSTRKVWEDTGHSDWLCAAQHTTSQRHETSTTQC